MKIKYKITNGTPNFTAVLQGSNVYTNNHTAAGSYEFTGVVNGVYNFSVTDSTGCSFDYGFINVNNNAFKVLAIEESVVEGNDIIEGVVIKSKTVTYKLGFEPSFESPPPSVNFLMGYNLITSELPIEVIDQTYGSSSVTVSKNGNPIFNATANSNSEVTSAAGQYLIENILPTDDINIAVSIATYEESGNESGSFAEITADGLTINGLGVAMDTSEFIINNNIT